MIETCKNFPSPEMLEKLAYALGKDTLDLFSVVPIQAGWQDKILDELEEVIARNRFAGK
jgi:hypothetical protein